MKTMKKLLPGLLTALLALSACDGRKNLEPDYRAGGLFTLSDENEHLAEVHDAVSASTGHGYDEEYLLTDLFEAPGAGVGDKGQPTKAGGYRQPLRELFADYLAQKYATKAGAADVERYINALSESDMQIYWPYSEDWDGNSFPIVTFDPGYGAESNYGYEVRLGKDGAHVVDSVLVTEQVARERPVWVINRNDDAGFTPLELFEGTAVQGHQGRRPAQLLPQHHRLHARPAAQAAGQESPLLGHPAEQLYGPDGKDRLPRRRR